MRTISICSDCCSKSQTSGDASYLKSSANLGSRQQHSAQDKLAVSEHIKVKSAIRNAGKRTQHHDSTQIADADSDSFSEQSSASDNDVNESTDKPERPASTVATIETPVYEHTNAPQRLPIGSALGTGAIKPIVRPRKKKLRTVPVSSSAI